MTLKTIQYNLNQIPKINHGGCGIAALAMWRWLKQNHPSKARRVKLIFLYSRINDSRIGYNRMAAKEGKKLSVPPHIALMLDGTIFDCVPDRKPQNEYVVTQVIEKGYRKLKRIVNIDEWNDSFNRRNVGKISKELGVDMSDILIHPKATV